MWRVRMAVTANILSAMKKRYNPWGKKTKATWKMLGYSPVQLRDHLQRLFHPGMTWDNYGKVWSIDHVLPVALHNIKAYGDKAMLACWSLDNLAPRFVTTDIAKRYGSQQVGNSNKGSALVWN